MANFIQPISSIQPLQPLESLKFQGSNEASEASGSMLNRLPFANYLRDAVSNLQETERVSDRDAYNLAMGNTDDLSQVMINSAKYATALEYTVQLSSRVVSAYKEIMQMQV